VGVVAVAFAIFQPFLLPLLWGAVLVIVTYHPYVRLRGLLGNRPRLAALVMTVLVMLLILGPFLGLALHFFEDAVALVADLQSESLNERMARVMENPFVKDAIGWAEAVTNKKINEEEVLARAVTLIGRPVISAAGNLVGIVLHLLAGLAFISLSTYYFYRDGPAAVRALRELLPMSEEDRDTILGHVHGAIVAAVRGGLVTAVAQGLLGLIILFILGFKQYVLWAAVMALASLIPLVGTAIVWVPMAGLLALDGEVAKGLVLAGYGMVVIGMADNLLRPLLVGRHMEAHPLVLFFGILGGISMFGFVGIILGPVLVALLGVTSRLFRREFGHPHGTPADPGAPAAPAAPPATP